MERQFNSIEDLVFNKSFREWILNNESSNAVYWEKWVLENPDKKEILNHSKAIMYALSVNHNKLSEEEISTEINKILQKLDNTTDTIPVETFYGDKNIIPIKQFFLQRRLWVGAAAILLIFFLSLYTIFYRHNNKMGNSAYYELPDGSNSTASIERVNNSDSVQQVNLSEGSKVSLFPRSKLTFSEDSAGSKREVYLTGQAFFQVAKNPLKPFFVFTKNMVTKVLGTSFLIRAYDNDKAASVEVRTGKVSVYKKENFTDSNIRSKRLDGIIVTPNQKMVYDFKSDQLTKTIIEKPVLLEPAVQNNFVFDGTPVKDVFKLLEDAYGIRIMYDDDLLSSCSLTATFGSEGFYDKISLICKAINASYEIIDGNIFITSKGCK
ncbi:FecR family protein [Ginsengibacter hankyongi]|uniref:FecR family protein n=1 Tax=Ginsengibacter hankyongi TaxID=2607284 RepID=A0A5J5ICM7_9BACT|nr:FecR family protein [Ginsengibacter hankyongi]KAA9036558.1 FecR family protein [Ginsengibacter hankyongi]